MSPRAWFRMENAATDPAVVDIHIIDFIGDWIDDYFGFGVTAKAFVDELAKLPDAVKTLRVHINSPGGDVFGALNIANALRDQQKSKGRTVETIVDGLAASAASIVMMAGSVIRVSDNALVMIHDPWSCVCGNANEMRKQADALDTIRNTITATYKWHSTLSEDELVALMDAETWMDADEAIANGFATEKVAGLKAAASLDRRALAKLTVPEKYRARMDAFLAPPAADPAPADAADVLQLCREANLDLPFAQALIAEKVTLDEARTRIHAERDTRAKAQTRASDITALCAKAKLADRAALYIKSTLSIEDIKRDLTELTVRLDRIEIDGALRPDQGARQVSAIDVRAVYAARNRLTTKKE